MVFLFRQQFSSFVHFLGFVVLFINIECRTLQLFTIAAGITSTMSKGLYKGRSASFVYFVPQLRHRLVFLVRQNRRG